MKEVLFKEKYNLMIKEFMKSDIELTKVGDFIDYFATKIEEHPVTTFIATFDHYTHTKGLKEGHVDDSILAAHNIIFCFGKDLESPLVMGVRPRSIAITELSDRFVISFQEAPKALANVTMQAWVNNLTTN